ncbi:unnamed protein product, partial [marine sediment metagenome]
MRLSQYKFSNLKTLSNKEIKMKTKVLYLILIVTLLLSACSSGGAAPNQTVDEPAVEVVENSPTLEVEQQSLPEQNP